MIKRLLLILGIVSASVLGAGCEKKADTSVGDTIEDATDNAGDAMEEAGDAVEDAAEDAAQ